MSQHRLLSSVGFPSAVACAAALLCCTSTSSAPAPTNDRGSGPATSLDSGVVVGDAARDSEADAYPDLTVLPQNPTLAVVQGGASSSLAFEAVENGALPIPVAWSFNGGTAVTAPCGAIDATSGVFVASGTVGGKLTVVATSLPIQARTQLTVQLHITENPDAVSAADLALLENPDAGSGPPFGFSTVGNGMTFMAGTAPPTLTFSGDPADAVLIRISFATLSYQGVFGAADGGELSLPASSWASITGSATESETAQVSVTKLSKGVVSGPSTATWTFLP